MFIYKIPGGARSLIQGVDRVWLWTWSLVRWGDLVWLHIIHRVRSVLRGCDRLSACDLLSGAVLSMRPALSVSLCPQD